MRRCIASASLNCGIEPVNGIAIVITCDVIAIMIIIIFEIFVHIVA
jgi:hypothetical protein